MVAERVEKKHMPTLMAWFRDYGWHAPEPLLPPTGFVVTHLGEPRAAGWLYNMDGPVAFMEYIVADPNLTYEERGKALDMLIERLSHYAKEQGYAHVFTVCRHDRLISRYKRHGFVVGDEDMTTLVRNL